VWEPLPRAVQGQETRPGTQALQASAIGSSIPSRGFFQPFDNPPTVNAIRAGSTAPIKFSLRGDRGLDILAGSPTSVAMDCNGKATNGIEESITAGSRLHYDATADQYIYAWKTNKVWASMCRQFSLTLNDGTHHQIYFRFK
jgi:hypothetical protein